MRKRTRGLDERFIEVCRLLNEHGVDYVVGGGVATTLHGHVRATKDIDVIVPRRLENTRRLLGALENLPLRLARELDPETMNDQIVTVIGDDPRVDVLKAMGKLGFADAARDARETTVNGVVIRYLSLRALKKAKDTDRLTDAADLQALDALGKRTAPCAGPTE